jgi:signal transduction histidine kinase
MRSKNKRIWIAEGERMELEPTIKPEPLPFPNRRKTVRRAEDIWQIRHTDALDTLLPDVRYDVKAILTTLHPIIEELRAEIKKIENLSIPERQAFKQQWSDVLGFSSDSIKRLIDRMKQVRPHTQASQCSIKTLVEGVLEDWRTSAEKKGVSIRCEGLENVPTILAYEWRLNSVFFSVISRAVHMTQPGGSVMVSGRLDQAKGTAVLEVKDTGPGLALPLCDAFNSGAELGFREMTASNAGHMFELQGARKIAEIHGGRISIERSEVAGTKVSISFPVG